VTRVSVLDASALVAYANGEPGGGVVDALLRDRDAVCYAHAVNLCEIYYGALRVTDERTARRLISDLCAAGVIERRDMSRRFWSKVGHLKSRGGISLADCFCVALGQHLVGQVVTADHREFDPIVPLGICTILFIR
jgi:PIN domain nuclease of toxin-antitoxin system